MNVLNLAVGKLTRVHRDLWACEYNYIGTYGSVSALNLVARKLARLFRDLQTHECSYTRTCGPMSVLNLVVGNQRGYLRTCKPTNAVT